MKIDYKIKQDLEKYLKEKLREEKEKIIIVSSYPLDHNDLGKIKTKFSFLKNSNNIVNQVDKSIIAGIVVKYGSKVIDLSLSSKLKNFKKLMYEANR